jgi:hypothetical protein
MKLTSLKTKELLRVYHSNKTFIALPAPIETELKLDNQRVFLTNDWNKCKEIVSDHISEATYIKYHKLEIKDILIGRLSLISKSYTQQCYYYTFEDFISKYGISNYNYQRLLKLEKEII